MEEGERPARIIVSRWTIKGVGKWRKRDLIIKEMKTIKYAYYVEY